MTTLTDILGDLADYPSTASIGWKPNPEVATAFDEWFLQHRENLGKFARALLKKKQEWLDAPKDHPFPHCKVCTVEWINDLLGLDADAEQEVEQAEENAVVGASS